MIHNEDKRSRDYETIKINLDPVTLIIPILKNTVLEISEAVEDSQLEKQLLE